MSNALSCYPQGVVFHKRLPYVVSEGCEVYTVLKTLLANGDISDLKGCPGEFTSSVLEYSNKFKDPFKAFVCAFYGKHEGIYLPADVSSMETAAWIMAESAFSYHKLLSGCVNSKKVTVVDYDVSIDLLKRHWCSGENPWRSIVKAYWVVRTYG